VNARNANPARAIIDESTRRRLAVLADVDPRSIDKLLLGQSVRGAAGIRALAVLADAGLLPSPEDTVAAASEGRP
jgi:hypothetical protein